MKKLMTSILCALLFLVAFIHCDRSKRSQAKKTTVTVLKWGDERILGPYKDVSAKLLIFLPLVFENEQGELEGRLARSWEHSSDFLTWTVQLRDDVKWHDGVPFTAHDIKFTLDLMAHPDVGWEVPDSYTVTVLDDFSYRIAFHKITNRARYPLSTWQVYYPKHLVENLDPKDHAIWEFWNHPVGNGPFRYVKHVPKTMVELEANPDFILGKPRIDTLILRFGGSTPLTELTSGNVDIAGISPKNTILYAKNPLFNVKTMLNPGGSTVLAWNHRNPLFQDVLVRKALTHAINRRELHHVLNFTDDIPIFDSPYEQRHIKQRELLEPIPYDLSMARKLLDEAGWKDRDNDGVREKDGKKFKFTVLIGGRQTNTAVYIQSCFSKIGIQMDISIGPIRPRELGGDFDAIIALFANEFGSRGPVYYFGRESFIGFKNPKVIELVEKGENAFTSEDRYKVFSQLMPIMKDEVPVIFLYPNVSFTAVHRRIKGFSSPSYNFFDTFAHKLWIEEEEK